MGSRLMEPSDIEAYATIYNPKEIFSYICMSASKIQSSGIFNNSNPLEYTVPLLLLQHFIASLSIMSTSWLVKPLGQPNMVAHILGGLALGPSFLGRLNGFVETIYPIRSLVFLDLLGALGLLFYFFLIGVQIDLSILKKIEKKEFLIGFSTFVLPMVLSTFTSIIFITSGFHLDPKLLRSLPIVAILTSTVRFPIVAQYLTELKMINSEFGRVALMSTMVSHSFGLIMIALTSFIRRKDGGIFRPIFAVIGLALVITFVIRPIVLWKLQRNPDGEPIKQRFIYMIFMGVLMSSFVSKVLGFHPNLGPFIFGMAIPAGPPVGSAIVEKLEFANSWLLMPLFFAKNGLVVDIFTVKLKDFVIVLFVILAACAGKFLGALFSALHSKVPLTDAILIGLATNLQGLIELSMFKFIYQTKVIPLEVYVILCLSLLMVTGTVTPILRYKYDPRRRYMIYKKRTILDMKPGSQLQVLACIHNQDNAWTTINLLEALHPRNSDPISVCALHLVELIGYSLPVLIPHKLSRNTPTEGSVSKSIIEAFRIFERRYSSDVTLHPFTSISPYATMHDDVCSMALERKTSLIVIPFHRRYTSGKPIDSLKVGVKNMNNKILEMAPCSVAILVDREVVKYSRPALTLFRISVFFLGGPDDREALAIGVRMATRENVSLCIIQVSEKEHFGTNLNHRSQMELDNDVVSGLRSQITDKKRLTCEEKVVRDATETITLVRSMEDQYDLVIVGRRHDTRSPIIRGLSDWDEYTDLGTIGDLFASQDFRSNATILVVQQHVNELDEWHGASKNYYDFRVCNSS